MEGAARGPGQLDAGRLGRQDLPHPGEQGRQPVRSLLCFARADGKLLWQKDVAYADKERNWNPNWYANASPVIDGERVVVSFASAGMYCYDLAGKELWKRTDLGKWEHAFGNGASPVLYGDLAILWCGPNEQPRARNFLLAVNKETGETVWEHDENVRLLEHAAHRQGERPGSAHPGPVPRREGAARGEDGYLKGFDPKTGKELWKCQGLNSYVYTSPLYGNGVAVAHVRLRRRRPGGQAGRQRATSPRTASGMHPKNTQRVGSGMIVGEHVYMVDENGMPHCYELKTGKDRLEGREARRQRHDLGFDGPRRRPAVRAHAQRRNGGPRRQPKFELLASTSSARASRPTPPWISNGEIFLRTFRHLWCIARRMTTMKPLPPHQASAWAPRSVTSYCSAASHRRSTGRADEKRAGRSGHAPSTLALEHVAALFEWPDAEMDAPDFLCRLLEATGCLLVLDVANLHADAVNFGRDPMDMLDRLPLERVAYVHVAGGIARDGVWHDSHAAPVPDEVFALAGEVAARRPGLAFLLERDDQELSARRADRGRTRPADRGGSGEPAHA